MVDPIGGVPAAAPAAGADAGQPAAARPAADAAPAAEADPPAATAGQDLDSLAQSLNQHAQDLQTSLRFQVDKVTGQMVISVIDTQNNQVLLQIPGQEALAVAQSLQRLDPRLMDKTA